MTRRKPELPPTAYVEVDYTARWVCEKCGHENYDRLHLEQGDELQCRECSAFAYVKNGTPSGFEPM